MNAEAEALRPMPPITIWIGFFAMVLGNFMALLDVQIVAASVGQIQAGVSASRDEISWVQTSYLIAEVIGIPLCGFLGRALGARLLFCLSAVTFAIASLLCALAWDINSLIVFRAAQGFFGAAMIPTTMATLYIVFPVRLQAAASVMIGVVTTFATSMGPTIGGYIAETLGWRAVFWINLAPAMACALLVWQFMKVDPGERSLLSRIDVAGLIGLALFLGGLQYILEEGAKEGWLASSTLCLCAVASAVGAALFFHRAVSSKNPIVDLRPFRMPRYAVGVALAFILGAGLYSSIFLMPLYLTAVRGFNALEIGHTMFVQGAASFIFGPPTAVAMRYISDPRPLGIFGFLCLGASCWVQSGITAEWGIAELALPQILRAAGIIFAFSAVMFPAISCLPKHLVHAGTSLFNTVRNLGGAFGIAILATMQKYDLEFHRQQLYAAVRADNSHVTQMLEGSRAALEQSGAAAPERGALLRYAQVLDREALVMTFGNLYWWLGAVLFVSALAMLMMKPAGQRGLYAAPDEAAAHG